MELFQGHRFEVWNFLLFEDKNLLVSTGYDGRIILWDLHSFEMLGIIKTFNKYNQTLNFHYKFEQFLIGDDSGLMQKYDFSQFLSPEYFLKGKKKEGFNVLKGYGNFP